MNMDVIYKMTPSEFDELNLNISDALEKLHPNGYKGDVSILGRAISSGNFELVEHIAKLCKKLGKQELLNRPCSLVRWGDEINSPPLVECCSNIDPIIKKKMMEVLLENGADSNQPQVDNRSKRADGNALSHASYAKSLDLVKLLIMHGANLKDFSEIYNSRNPAYDESKSTIARACAGICAPKCMQFNLVDQLIVDVRKLIFVKMFHLLNDVY